MIMNERESENCRQLDVNYSSITYLDAGNFNEKHGGTENMSSVITAEFDAFVLNDFVKVDGLDFVHGLHEIGLIIESLVNRDCTNFHVILQNELINRFRRMCHENTTFKVRLCQTTKENTHTTLGGVSVWQ